jgi:DNA-binding XRE family transcriptional regulator
MRTSPQRNTLAVLRVLLGIGQKQMGELVGRSMRTIQAVELGQLKLSEELAVEIARQTGVSLDWLTAGDVSKPPVTWNGKPYSKKNFEEAQAALAVKWGQREEHGFWTYTCLASHIMHYCMAAMSALERGKFQLFQYKAARALVELGEQFGESKAFSPRPPARAIKGDPGALFKDQIKHSLDDLFKVADKVAPFPESIGRQPSTSRKPRPNTHSS